MVVADISELLEANSGIRLDIGCGRNKTPGWVGMDFQELEGVDIVHDWNDMPWPLPDESCLQILASHVVEHVNPANGHFLRWMDECWRLLKPNGSLAIIVPYATSHGMFQDPTHCNFCNETTWAYFDPEHYQAGPSLYGFYTPKPWRVQTCYYDPNANMEAILRKRDEA